MSEDGSSSRRIFLGAGSSLLESTFSSAVAVVMIDDDGPANPGTKLTVVKLASCAKIRINLSL